MQLPSLSDLIPEGRRGLFVTLSWFLVIVALNQGMLFAPPVWDTAMGVFPPALYLYQNSFDIGSLILEENWWQGGPNVHSLSLVTWIIAAVMKVTGDPGATFLALHVSTFFLMAWGLMVYGRLLRGFGFGPVAAVAGCAFVLVFTVHLVQVSYMYTEIPVMVCSIAAVNLWRRGRIDFAIWICVLALFIKFTAVVLALPMTTVLLVDRSSGQVQKTARLTVLLRRSSGGEISSSMDGSTPVGNWAGGTRLYCWSSLKRASGLFLTWPGWLWSLGLQGQYSLFGRSTGTGIRML